MRARLLIATLVMSFGLHAKAAEVCETLTECRDLQRKVETRIRTLLEVPELTDLVLGGNGYPGVGTWRVADNYCRANGMRLPTTRELALVAQSMGARGISSIAQIGYAPVYNFEGNTTVIDFYYNPSNYIPPAGDLGRYRIWSANDAMNGDSYIFDGRNGALGVYSRIVNNSIAVRCAK